MESIQVYTIRKRVFHESMNIPTPLIKESEEGQWSNRDKSTHPTCPSYKKKRRTGEKCLDSKCGDTTFSVIH
jgi:hypothetical protein